MAQGTASIVGNSIVLIGAFDPTRIQPGWLITEKLLREADLAELTFDYLFPDAVGLRTSWMTLVVEPTKVSASTTLTSPMPEPVRDFVLDLVDGMTNVRVTAIGINTDHHFGTRDTEVWHQIGHLLAPKEIWNKVLKQPGMRAIFIEGQRDDSYRGRITVRAEPSSRIQPGVYLQVNDHFELVNDEADRSPTALLKCLTDEWNQSLERAKRIIDTVRELGGIQVQGGTEK